MRRHRLLPIALAAALAGGPLVMPANAFASAHGKEEKKAPPTYFQLDPINAVVLRRDGRRGVMTVDTGIEAKDPVLMARAQASTPRLRAAFAQVLMVYAAGLRGGIAPDMDYVGRELQKACDQVLGKPGAKVLMGSAMLS
ncbi:hypothetical protein [Caulobacter segnis]|jgi:hypothetical protein|uniref:hypothetical protein n=1 Tax=Caulobacter segnis TaxID=88688 RepID=UPI001CBA7F77|nr:hypothetical protein [Caulobacter segnis]UAL10437.1 hypothetical protein K8940_22185 [Caulobacter segnis]